MATFKQQIFDITGDLSTDRPVSGPSEPMGTTYG